MNPQELMLEARDWVADCVWTNLEPEDFVELIDAAIRNAVESQYEGGWAAFATAAETTPSPAPLTAGPRARPSALALA